MKKIFMCVVSIFFTSEIKAPFWSQVLTVHVDGKMSQYEVPLGKIKEIESKVNSFKNGIHENDSYAQISLTEAYISGYNYIINKTKIPASTIPKLTENLEKIL